MLYAVLARLGLLPDAQGALRRYRCLSRLLLALSLGLTTGSIWEMYEWAADRFGATIAVGCSDTVIDLVLRLRPPERIGGAPMERSAAGTAAEVTVSPAPTTAVRDTAGRVWVPQPLAFVGAWSWRFLLGAAAIAVLGWLALQAFVVVVPVVLALFLAAGLAPAVDWLHRHRVPAGLAGVLVFAGFLGLVGALGFWLSVRLRGQFDLLSAGLRAGTEQIKDWLVTGPLGISRERVEQAEFDLLTTFGGIDAGGSGLTRQLLGRVRLATEVLGGLALLLFALFFLLKDGRRMGAWLLERTPPRYRDDASAVVGAVRQVAQQVLVGMILIGLADALLMGLALAVIGVPLVLPLVVLTFIGGFLPVIGATAAAAAAVLVALVTGGPGDALLVVVAAVAVQQVDGNLLQPLIMSSAVRLHPLVTAIAVTAGLVLGGLLGAFLAVPLVASGARIAHHYRTRHD